MSCRFYDLLKYAKTGVAAHSMTQFDMMWSLAMSGFAHRTLTGVPPISFTGNGKPLKSVDILGNAQQTGTPSPDNIIMPDFCGVRTGNLFDKTTVIHGYYVNDTTGVIATVPTYAEEANASDYIPVSGEYVHIYSNPNGKWRWAAFYDSNKAYVSGVNGYNKAIAIPANAAYMRLTVVDEILDTLMVNLGSTALPYEPYGYKIPITNAGQTVPVYLGQTQTVRRIRKLVLTGEGNWRKYTQSSDTLYYLVLGDRAGAITATCSHCVYSDSVPASTTPGVRISNSMASLLLNLGNAIGSNTETDFKAYLAAQHAAGTPVTVWYVLAEPETAIVNEPLAKIGDYADELRSAIPIPTVNGLNTLTVDTDLQPSSVSITGNIAEAR